MIPDRFILNGFLIGLFLTMAGTVCVCSAQQGVAAYGTKVAFTKGVAVHFADFDLTYAGERREASKVYPRGFLFHDFNAVQGKNTVKVSWSSGTGEIAPRAFTIGGRKFQLELRRSDKLGKLKEDELVVSKAEG